MNFKLLFANNNQKIISRLLSSIAEKLINIELVIDDLIDEKMDEFIFSDTSQTSIFNFLSTLYGKSCDYHYKYLDKKQYQLPFPVLSTNIIQGSISDRLNKEIKGEYKIENGIISTIKDDKSHTYNMVINWRLSTTVRVEFNIKNIRNNLIQLKNINFLHKSKNNTTEKMMRDLQILLEQLKTTEILYKSIISLVREENKSECIHFLMNNLEAYPEIPLLISMFLPESSQEYLWQHLLIKNKLVSLPSLLSFFDNIERELKYWHQDAPYFDRGDMILFDSIHNIKEGCINKGGYVYKKMESMRLQDTLTSQLKNKDNIKKSIPHKI